MTKAKTTGYLNHEKNQNNGITKPRGKPKQWDSQTHYEKNHNHGITRTITRKPIIMG